MSRRMVALLGAALLLALPAHAADLVLRRVMLSTGGVGYFESAAEMDGPATLGLDVPLDQVDDVLTSLVVFDSAGGVGGIELPGADNAHAAFGDVPFGSQALDSPLAFLNSLQGVVIEVRGPHPMTGRLLQVEQVAESAALPGNPGATVMRSRVSVLTAAGLQQFVLEDADSVQVADPDLRARIDRALDAVRREAGHDVRHLTIRSAGTGHRTVRVGYVAGAPLWKTSYRLALPEGAGDGHARLQGWAVLENASGVDWDGVELTLQAGNPVTFRQAIYRSYFVQRPEVPVEVFGRILPEVDTVARPAVMQAARGVRVGAPPPVGAPAPAAPTAMAAGAIAAPAEAAETVEGAEETSFTLASPVMLAAGHTASVPILDRTVPAARIGLVQQGRPHPLAAVRLTNDTPSSFPPGVLTLYDQGAALSFAGDAQIGGLPAGESRLLSFAEDLRTAVDWHVSQATTLANVTAASGVLHVDERLRTTSQVTITAPPHEPRTLLVEIARQGDATLVPPDPPNLPGLIEETASAWRLPVSLQAGETRHLTVALDRIVHQQTALIDGEVVIDRVLGEQGLRDAARAALRHLVEMRAAEAAATAARDRLRAQQAAVEHDEDRLRKNLDAVPATDALHGRLVRQLTDDENRLADLATALAAADAAVQQAHKATLDAIADLKI